MLPVNYMYCISIVYKDVIHVSRARFRRVCYCSNVVSIGKVHGIVRGPCCRLRSCQPHGHSGFSYLALLLPFTGPSGAMDIERKYQNHNLQYHSPAASHVKVGVIANQVHWAGIFNEDEIEKASYAIRYSCNCVGIRHNCSRIYGAFSQIAAAAI